MNKINKIYIAQEVVRKSKWDGYAYAHNFIGCKIHISHYIKQEIVLITENGEKGFTYLNKKEKFNILSNNIINKEYDSSTVCGCYTCEEKRFTCW